MTIVWCLDIALTLLLSPFFLYLLLITAAACIPGRARPRPSSRARFAFVIPAHNEEDLIAATIRSCRAVDYDPGLVMVAVIADHCTDETARVAHEEGAIVVERTDTTRRGKGFALDDYLGRCHAARARQEPDAVVVIDADTVVDPGILHALSGALAGGAEWIQGYYSVRNAEAAWRTRLMTYAFSLINGVWLLGQDRLGWGAALRGNGMCFATRALERVPWKAHGLTEDQEFSWMLRIAGETVAFEPAARVYAQMLTRGGPAAVAQRRRWEVGRGSLRRQFLGPLLRSGRIGPFRKVMSIIELFFPPLVPLCLAWLAAASVHVVLPREAGWPSLSARLVPIHALMAAVLLGYVLSPLLVLGLPWRFLLSLLALPRYVVWKGFAALHRRPTEWVRTARESAGARARDGTANPV
jgi:1,2-diacylglycerol 3-beta-glucosyltransferase